MSTADVSTGVPAGEPDPALAAWSARLSAAVAEELPAAVELRHRLHADPRASGDEQDTADAVVAALGLGEGRRVAGTGRLVRVVDGPGRAVALRAELDGLAVDEATGVPWSSAAGVMHACGHDAHLAGLVAVGRAVARVGGPAPLLLLLQPREEGAPSGAADVVASGVLTEERVDSVVAAHVQPQLPAGVVNATPGPVNASTDEFTLTVTGRGGHGSYPHTTLDPVLALCAIVVDLQHLVSRRVDPTVGAVLGIGQLEAGSAFNVVPDTARARGGLRVMREEDRELLLRALTDVAEHTAAAYGCTAVVESVNNMPVLANDPGLARAAAAWLGRDGVAVDDGWRSFGADDFSHFCTAHRGLMLFLGVDGGPADADGRRPGLHSPRFLPGDEVVGEVAAALLAGYLAGAELLGPAEAPAPGEGPRPT
ncbi:M20 metallopeptidase family protein [Modestobacter versicolor]|uniref:M20 metallopeptidase family protein n=1 Tax=Modestobacter versicolor TaxID=429133 RepID=UPI0034DF089C